MSSQVLDPPNTGVTHPVAVFADRLNTRLDELADQPLHALTPVEERHAMTSLARGKAKYEALQLRLLGHADLSGACLEAGAADAAAWLAAETRQTRREARADLALSKRLDSLPVLDAGMTAGAVSSAQARAVVRSLDCLPTSGEFAVSRDQLVKAEAHLVGLCATYDAQEVEALGRRLFEVIAPEAAEAYEGKMLQAEEAKAARKISLEMSIDDQGVAHGRFRYDAGRTSADFCTASKISRPGSRPLNGVRAHGQALASVCHEAAGQAEPPPVMPRGISRRAPAE